MMCKQCSEFFFLPIRIRSRQCYFNDERELQFYRVYNKPNCELECLANAVYHECGCVGFAAPSICGYYILFELICNYIRAGLDTTPICERTNEIDCMQSIKDRYLAGLLPMHRHTCNCLPACNTVEYEAEQVIAIDRMADHNEVAVLLMFKDNEIDSQKRIVRFGPIQLAGNCCGLLGLFMGISILSLVELVYFFSLRLICNSRRYHY